MIIEEKQNVKVKKYYCDCCGRQIKSYSTDNNIVSAKATLVTSDDADVYTTAWNIKETDLCKRCQRAILNDFTNFMKTYISRMKEDSIYLEFGNKDNEIGYSGLSSVEYIKNKADIFWKKFRKQ